jgi:hypothetical protein
VEGEGGFVYGLKITFNCLRFQHMFVRILHLWLWFWFLGGHNKICFTYCDIVSMLYTVCTYKILCHTPCIYVVYSVYIQDLVSHTLYRCCIQCVHTRSCVTHLVQSFLYERIINRECSFSNKNKIVFLQISFERDVHIH